MRFRSALLPALFVGAALVAPAALQKGGLRPTRFPDGTGSIGLPAGWDIESANRGQVQVGNGKGDLLVLGMPWAVLRPGQLPGLSTETVANARTGDLRTALAQVLAKNTGSRLLSVRGRPAPSAQRGTPAAFLLYEFSSNGQVFTGLGYFATLDYGPSSPSWQLYSSAVIAPKARFTKSLPTMMAIWRSWKTNGADPLRGSQSEQLDKILQGRRDSYQKIQEQFRERL